ncbi:MAG TPA: DNA cytosine methyltransferase [Solirubrobacteraceae bacterium]|nr:DNA cytosine methyltransferase [Solirubrobacteraceae bacterium]
MADTYRIIDLFAGCGGLTYGFEATGRFRSVFAVESDAAAAQTYERNFESPVFAGPIEKVKQFPVADVVIGGPPCQGFSPLNMRGVGLDRRTLWREYLRALKQSEPVAFVMENVPELLRSAEYESFVKAATKLGFNIEGRILNAADYGVPQRRRRAIVIGSQQGSPRWPQQSHFSPDKTPPNGLPWRTFRQAVAGLALKPSGRNWHNPRKPRPMSVERYRTIPNEGEGRFDLAARRPDITPDCWLRKESGSTDVFGRLWWDRPAYTIRTEFFKPEKGRYLHPSEHRPITVREAARCMSFTDEFEFPAEQSMTAVAKQIGNAVPPMLAQVIATTLAGRLDEYAPRTTAVAA